MNPWYLVGPQYEYFFLLDLKSSTFLLWSYTMYWLVLPGTDWSFQVLIVLPGTDWSLLWFFQVLIGPCCGSSRYWLVLPGTDTNPKFVTSWNEKGPLKYIFFFECCERKSTMWSSERCWLKLQCYGNKTHHVIQNMILPQGLELKLNLLWRTISQVSILYFRDGSKKWKVCEHLFPLYISSMRVQPQLLELKPNQKGVFVTLDSSLRCLYSLPLIMGAG